MRFWRTPKLPRMTRPPTRAAYWRVIVVRTCPQTHWNVSNSAGGEPRVWWLVSWPTSFMGCLHPGQGYFSLSGGLFDRMRSIRRSRQQGGSADASLSHRRLWAQAGDAVTMPETVKRGHSLFQKGPLPIKRDQYPPPGAGRNRPAPPPRPRTYCEQRTNSVQPSHRPLPVRGSAWRAAES